MNLPLGLRSMKRQRLLLDIACRSAYFVVGHAGSIVGSFRLDLGSVILSLMKYLSHTCGTSGPAAGHGTPPGAF